ncbi:MAG: PAS domain-containing sensor histidine kinase [Arcobacteraceae bacterium]|nr:PAS domain S-box protein [Arcobacteraceae bacterium]
MQNNKILQFDKILFIVLAIFALWVVFTYIYVKSIQNKNRLYFEHNDKINQLIEYNASFDDFINSNIKVIVFDTISSKINNFEDNLELLLKDAQEYRFDFGYIRNLKNIDNVFLNKKLQMERLKSRKAFAFNIFTYLIDIEDIGYLSLNIEEKEHIDTIRIYLASLAFDIEYINKIKKYLFSIQELENQNQYIKNYIKLTDVYIKYYEEINQAMHNIKNIDINEQLNGLKKNLKQIAQQEKAYTNLILNSVFFIVLILIVLVIWILYKIYKTRKELIAFKTAVENSHSVVVITDTEQNITFVNSAFEKITGYSIKEAIGAKPNVLKSGKQDENFYKKMAQKIYAGEIWHGRFVNKKKNGDIFYEDATIAPIVIDGKIDSYLAIKTDVTKLVNATEELSLLNANLEKKVEEKIKLIRQKDALIMQQSRLLALGEMITNISHQWRQPLSSITLSASGLKYKKELGILNLDDDFDKELDTIINVADELSLTIDKFKKIVKIEKDKQFFEINSSIKQNIKLIKSIYKQDGIKIILELDEKEMRVNGFETQFSQVVLNILNNAKEALNKSDIDQKYIKITTKEDNKGFVITIIDNAGGISSDIISKIYDPYFTTKHKSQGTGMGLFMAYEIVKNSFDGYIDTKNINLKIENKEYLGASISIFLPKEEA